MRCRFGPRNGAVFTISPVNDTNLTPSDTSAEATNGDAPPKFLKTIKSFVRRAGRITTGQSKAFVDLGEKYLLNYDANLKTL